MAYSSSTLYNGLFIVNGNVLMGNNVASNSPIGYPAGSTRLIYSGDTFSNSKSQYYTGTHLQLDAQGIVGPSGKAWGGSIFLEGGRETPGGSNTHGSIEFLTGGFEAMRVASNGYVGINISTPIYTLDVKGITNISQLLIVSTISSGSILASGNISTSGNINASSNIIAGGNINASSNISASGTISGSNMILTANMKSFNLNTDGSITAGSNIVATNDIITFGNFIGDGSKLTNLPSGSMVSSRNTLSRRTHYNTYPTIFGDDNHIIFPDLLLPTETGLYAFFCYENSDNPQVANEKYLGCITFILSVNAHPAVGKVAYITNIRHPQFTYYGADIRVGCREIINGSLERSFGIDNATILDIQTSSKKYCLDFDYYYRSVDDTYSWTASYSKIL